MSLVCATEILTRSEGAFLCALCSRGEAALRLTARQRAAPGGLRNTSQAGSGPPRPGPGAPSPELRRRHSRVLGLRAPSPQLQERPQQSTAPASDRAGLREETERKRWRARGPTPAGKSLTRVFWKQPNLGKPGSSPGPRGAVPGAARPSARGSSAPGCEAPSGLLRF